MYGHAHRCTLTFGLLTRRLRVNEWVWIQIIFFCSFNFYCVVVFVTCFFWVYLKFYWAVPRRLTVKSEVLTELKDFDVLWNGRNLLAAIHTHLPWILKYNTSDWYYYFWHCRTQRQPYFKNLWLSLKSLTFKLDK